MKNKQTPLPLNQAVDQFLSTLKSENLVEANLALSSVIRWFGPSRDICSIKPAEISRYCQQFSQSDTEASQKINNFRAFLRYARKEGWVRTNLAGSAATRKARSSNTASRNANSPIVLTDEGYNSLKNELEALKEKRPSIVEAIKLAAADKDFKENSPLDAAKEELGHVDGRIRELEETLKVSTVNSNDSKSSHRVSLGKNIRLKDANSGEEFKCVIVNTREANPLNGKISDSSPIGKALMGRQKGEVVDINTPGGKMCYRIQAIGEE